MIRKIFKKYALGMRKSLNLSLKQKQWKNLEAAKPRYKIVSHAAIDGNDGIISHRSTSTLYVPVNLC